MPPIYDPEAVKPMWQELANVGVQPLTTPEDVDEALAKPGISMVVVNSVCGCAAGGARPGVMKALQNELIPDQLTTVFAGMDQEAVARAREKMPEIQPSSPCIALFENGQPIFVLERRHIEQMNADTIAQKLQEVFNQKCAAKGPSIAPEEFQKLIPHEACGSSIPMFQS